MKTVISITPEWIWCDPNLQWLILHADKQLATAIYRRLYASLAPVLPSPSTRKEHILVNMLHFSSANDQSTADFPNVYTGDLRQLDQLKKWGVRKFDVLLSNGPHLIPQGLQRRLLIKDGICVAVASQE